MPQPAQGRYSCQRLSHLSGQGLINLGTLQELRERLEDVKRLLTVAKLDYMILLAENAILADEIGTEMKALLAQDSIVAKLSKEVYECSLVNSENGIHREEVEILRQKNEKLHQKNDEMLEGIKERNQKIQMRHQETERMSLRVRRLEVDVAFW